MTQERWTHLMNCEPPEKLTLEERTEGWHWCCEWDGLLVGPGMDELEPCSCLPKEHPVYTTIPPRPIVELEVPGMSPEVVRKMERLISDHLRTDPEFQKKCEEVVEESFRLALFGTTKPSQEQLDSLARRCKKA